MATYRLKIEPKTLMSNLINSKQPVTDTLRSGPLADTLRGGDTMRASPQYRVSDIDPEFARRFREDHY